MRWLRVLAIFAAGITTNMVVYGPVLVFLFLGHDVSDVRYQLDSDGWWRDHGPALIAGAAAAALVSRWLFVKFRGRFDTWSSRAAVSAMVLAALGPPVAYYFWVESEAIADARGTGLEHDAAFGKLATLRSIRGRSLLEAPFKAGTRDAIPAGQALARLGSNGRSRLVRLAHDPDVPLRGRYLAALSPPPSPRRDADSVDDQPVRTEGRRSAPSGSTDAGGSTIRVMNRVIGKVVGPALCAASVVGVLSVAPAAAQTPAPPPAARRGPPKDPRAGLLIGGAATYVTVPKGVSRKMGPGGMAGLFAVIPLIGTYKLQPEAAYDYRESEVLGEKRRYEYFTGALLVRVSLFKGLYITEGPAYHRPWRVRFGARDVTSNTRDDLSLIIGVGKRWGHAAMEGRWDSGIRSVQKTLGPGDVPTRHRSIDVVFAIF